MHTWMSNKTLIRNVVDLVWIHFKSTRWTFRLHNQFSLHFISSSVQLNNCGNITFFASRKHFSFSVHTAKHKQQLNEHFVSKLLPIFIYCQYLNIIILFICHSNDFEPFFSWDNMLTFLLFIKWTPTTNLSNVFEHLSPFNMKFYSNLM